MTTPAVPASLSLYRGQSRTGIGEGPGDPVPQGDQYLAADPPLAGDGALLAAVRPWFSLDIDPDDHRRLGDGIEGWSCFTHRDLLFVVRLCAAGVYDRRAAYFAHGRAWRLDAMPPGCDPGLFLGRSEAFDLPWRDGARAAPSPASAPLLDTAPIAKEPDAAARLLAHLFQAVAGEYPVIVALPVEELTAASPLPALLAFSRAALPADLRQACNVRVNTRLPELFLRQRHASLLAVPEPVAGAALRIRGDAVLLDRRFEVKAGPPAAPRSLAYAEAVVGRALALPEGLACFAERYARSRSAPGLPADADLRTVQITYNLAYAFAAPGERGHDLVTKYLPWAARTFGPGLAWERLIGDEEWRRLPVSALGATVLRGVASASPGERELVAAVAAALGRLGVLLDGVLKTESAALARLAADPHHGPEVFAVLARATSQGLLSPAWAGSYVRAAAAEELVAAAERLLPSPFFWERWDDVPRLLLDGLRRLEPAPIELRSALAAAAARLDPIARLETYVRLVDLLAVLAPDERLLDRLRDELPRLQDHDLRRDLVRIALDGEWRCFDRRFLVRPDGELALPWVDGVADLLLASNAVVAELTTPALLRLAAAVDAGEPLDPCLAELDRRAEERLAETTEALILGGWWQFWTGHRRNGLPLPGRRRLALAFLSSAVWTRADSPQALRESWLRAVEDLAVGRLAGRETRELCSDGRGVRRWPWIPAFEREQLQELASLAGDLGALAEIAATVRPEEQRLDLGAEVPEMLLRQADARLSADLPRDALRWLLVPPPRERVLDLAASQALCDRAGHLEDRALLARARSVAAQLEVDPMRALAAAGEPDLFRHEGFLDALAAWMEGSGRRAADPAIWREIDRRVAAAPPRRLAEPPVELARLLARAHCPAAAEFLVPGGMEKIGTESLVLAVVRALREGLGADPCWDEIRVKILERRGAETRRHPLTLVAEEIRSRRGAPPAEVAALQTNGWPAFAVAAARDATLLAACPFEPVLPAFALAASLTAGGNSGSLATQIACTRGAQPYRSQVEWWQALVRGLRDCRRRGGRRSADDREDVALALLHQIRDALEPGELQAFVRALPVGARSEETMNRMVTFFRDPRLDAGETYDVRVKTPQEALSLLLYSRQPLETSALQDCEQPDRERCGHLIKDLRMQISSAGGGGLMAVVKEGNDHRSVKIDPVRTATYRPPGHFLVLEAARPAYAQPIGGKEIELPAGAHLLVPVDEDADGQLRLFVQMLDGVSPDLRSLVLDSIRRPSLEARLARLEDAGPLGAGAVQNRSPAAATWMGRAAARLRGWLPLRPRPGMVMNAVLLAALVANAFWMQRLTSALAAAPPAAAPAAAVGGKAASPARAASRGAHGGPAAAAAAAAGDPLAGGPDAGAAVRSLLAALRARSGANRNLRWLYDLNFSAADGTDTASPDVSRLFSQSSRPFLWGLIKLQALHLKPDADPAFLAGAEGIAATKAVFRQIPRDVLTRDRPGLDLLVVAACHLGYRTPRSPGLPETGQGAKQDPAIEFLPGGDCKAYGPGRSAAGLRALTAFVNGYREAAR